MYYVLPAHIIRDDASTWSTQQIEYLQEPTFQRSQPRALPLFVTSTHRSPPPPTILLPSSAKGEGVEQESEGSKQQEREEK